MAALIKTTLEQIYTAETELRLDRIYHEYVKRDETEPIVALTTPGELQALTEDIRFMLQTINDLIGVVARNES